MTRATKLVTVPLSVATATAIFSAGVAVGHVREMQAQFVTRPEYATDRNALQMRMLRDSLVEDARHAGELQRLDRIERVVLKIACHDFPSECEK